MNNYVVTPFSIDSNHSSFFKFCKLASEEVEQPASTNMWNNDWENVPGTLPYCLIKEKRFESPNGTFLLLEHNGEIVACSGIYRSDFCKDVAIGGTRTWINKEHRHKNLVRDVLLPAHKKWAIDNGFKAIALTFNDYNKNIIQLWNRKRLGERRSKREPHHIFFDNLYEVDFPLYIQYTKQWLIFEQLTPDFYFDWESIEFKSE